MRISAKMSIVLVLTLAVSGAAQAFSGQSPNLTSQATWASSKSQTSNNLILVQQPQPDNDAAKQGEQEEHDVGPGCRYRGGDKLELIV